MRDLLGDVESLGAIAVSVCTPEEFTKNRVVSGVRLDLLKNV